MVAMGELAEVKASAANAVAVRTAGMPLCFFLRGLCSSSDPRVDRFHLTQAASLFGQALKLL